MEIRYLVPACTLDIPNKTLSRSYRRMVINSVNIQSNLYLDSFSSSLLIMVFIIDNKLGI